MAVRDLVQLERAEFFSGDTFLRKVTIGVESFGPDLRELVDALIETLLHHRIAVGLAAPQIGSSLRVAVVSPERVREKVLVLVNPAIVSVSGRKERKRESCMSLPGYGAEVERRAKVLVSHRTLDGGTESVAAEGFLARVVQHEIDHLDGRLYVDRVAGEAAIVSVDLFAND